MEKIASARHLLSQATALEDSTDISALRKVFQLYVEAIELLTDAIDSGSPVLKSAAKPLLIEYIDRAQLLQTTLR